MRGRQEVLPRPDRALQAELAPAFEQTGELFVGERNVGLQVLPATQLAPEDALANDALELQRAAVTRRRRHAWAQRVELVMQTLLQHAVDLPRFGGHRLIRRPGWLVSWQ